MERGHSLDLGDAASGEVGDASDAHVHLAQGHHIKRLCELPDLVIFDFGTRRRHGFLWQRWCVEALKEGLGSRFIGSSNFGQDGRVTSAVFVR